MIFHTKEVENFPFYGLTLVPFKNPGKSYSRLQLGQSLALDHYHRVISDCCSIISKHQSSCDSKIRNFFFQLYTDKNCYSIWKMHRKHHKMLRSALTHVKHRKTHAAPICAAIKLEFNTTAFDCRVGRTTQMNIEVTNHLIWLVP